MDHALSARHTVTARSTAARMDKRLGEGRRSSARAEHLPTHVRWLASQMLSTGLATLEWIADQVGHTSTAMIFRHYAKWISQDRPDVVGLLNQALRLNCEHKKGASEAPSFCLRFPSVSKTFPCEGRLG